jgi:hypothetical protein
MKGLNILIITMIEIVFCYALQLTCMFVGSSFGHGMWKATQYATIDINVCVGF